MHHFPFDFETDVVLIMRNFFKSFTIQTKYGTTAAVTATSIIVSSIGLALIYVYTRKKRGKDVQRVFTRSISVGALHGGKLAVERLLHFHEMRANRKMQNEAVEQLEKTIECESPNFLELQNIIAMLEMSGQEDKAIEILKEAAKKAKAKPSVHHEYEYQMLLVEMLIYKGNYVEAEKASCLNHEEASDVRRPLYKAMIQLLLDNPTKAEKEWKEFKDMRSQFLLPPDIKDSQFYKLVTDFEKFKQVVDLLKKEIDERKKAK